VFYDGVDMKDIHPSQRGIGMVFQNYALYPHLTAKKNLLSYFLFRKKTPDMDEMAQQKLEETARLLGVEIKYLLDREPAQLSGGERQRIAIGRCITRDPRLFLMDEPFSSLDQKLREQYRVNLKKLLTHFKITTVYVTHDQREAVILADMMVVMNIGTIEQVGAPKEIYEQPANSFVAGFFNWGADMTAINLLEGEAVAPDLAGLMVGVRPEDLEVVEDGVQPAIRGKIETFRLNPMKKDMVLTINHAGRQVTVATPARRDLSIDTQITLRLKRYHVFDKETGKRLRSVG
jgi:ABC-type sugar transport system ATPase subunit